jgi:flagellar basal body-associated protein FliL
MEIMIMVALVMFILTGMISIALTLWYVKVFHPFIKPLTKVYSKMLGQLEEEIGEDLGFRRVK